MPDIDIDELERVEARMTPGPWGDFDGGINAPSGNVLYPVMVDEDPLEWSVELEVAPGDFDGIIAIRNAMPALLAELRELRAFKARRCGTCVYGAPWGNERLLCERHKSIHKQPWHCADWANGR